MHADYLPTCVSKQLVTLPYNLLMQKTAREALGISLQDHAVVIDEAHNVIDNILAIHTVSVTSRTLSVAAQATQVYLKKFTNRLKGKNA